MSSSLLRTGRPVVAVIVASAIAAAAARAQMPVEPRPPVPQIIVSASEEIEVTPDRAALSFAVETRGKTAAQAGAENARIQAAVLDTLRKSGILAAQLRTQGVSIMPEYEYPQDGSRPKVIGYLARNAVLVEVRQIGRVGNVIDAGLARGATNVGGLRFFASNTSEARREAMTKAVARAREDAAAIATAAGGRLGDVLEITSMQGYEGPVQYDAAPMMAVRAEKVATPIEAGNLKVSVSISARFAYLPRQ